MRIIQLRASNIKRLKAIDITPGDEAVVTIGGNNGQGKSSTLDAIMYALGGTTTIPAQPIRKGQRRAKVRLDLGDIVVERSWTNGGGSKLMVTDADGVKQRSPQGLLDALCGKIAFDPLEYSRMPAKRQAEVLRELIGVDTGALDEQRQQLYEQRTDLNRELSRLKAQLKSMPAKHADAPAVEVSIAALTDELEQRRGQLDENDRQRRAATTVEKSLTAHDERVAVVERDIETTKAHLAELERELGEAKAKRVAVVQQIDNAKAKVAALVDPDLDEVREQLRTAEDTNRLVRQNKQRKDTEDLLLNTEGTADQLTDAIAEIDAQKRDLLAEAEMPLPGLGFDEDGVTLEGVPLEQASQAEQLRLSVAMGFRLNPKLRVLLVRDGSLLDENSLRLVAELAEKHDGQLWLERVGADEGATVVIEDGSVREPVQQKKAG